MTRATTRFAMPALVVIAVFALGATALSAPPYQPSNAQKQAEYACLAHDVKPRTPVWELCLSHVTRAFEWDEPSLALQLAHAAGSARTSCRDNGLRPDSANYRVCVEREIDAHSLLMVLGDQSGSTNVAEVH